MRAVVRRAATLILRAEDELQEAGSVIANVYLRPDREAGPGVVKPRSKRGNRRLCSGQTTRPMRRDDEDATSTIRPSSAIPDRSSDRVASRSGRYSTTIV
jgi:hypothetical protein